MGEKKKWAAGCCCLLFLLIVLFGGAVGGFFLAWTELVVDFVCFSLRLTQSTLELANMEFDIFKHDLIKYNYSFERPEEWAPDPMIYTREIVQLTEEEEDEILAEFNDAGIFYPREDFINYNSTEPGRGQLGALMDIEPEDLPDPCNLTSGTPGSSGRRKRSGGFSRICPAYIPGPTNLVAFADNSGSGQIVNLNNYVQWVFNEECSGRYCSTGSCNCRKVARRQQAYIWILQDGKSPSRPIQKSITVHSCVAVR